MAYAQRFETGAVGHLLDDEVIELAVRASVPPTTMTMAAGTFVGVFAAITINQGVTDLGARLIGSGIAVAGILVVYALLGSSFGERLGPYVVLGLSDRRVLVFERDMIGRLKGEPLIAHRSGVTVEMRRRPVFLPHRLTVTGLAPSPLLLDVPRIEPSTRLVEELGGTTTGP